MRGLEVLNRLNDLQAAKVLLNRYLKLRKRALKRGDEPRAARYSRKVTGLGRFISGVTTKFPGRSGGD